MRTAVLAARAGMADEAVDRMTQANAAARHVPDGVYHGTAFGPSCIRVHKLALATARNGPRSRAQPVRQRPCVESHVRERHLGHNNALIEHWNGGKWSLSHRVVAGATGHNPYTSGPRRPSARSGSGGPP